MREPGRDSRNVQIGSWAKRTERVPLMNNVVLAYLPQRGIRLALRMLDGEGAIPFPLVVWKVFPSEGELSVEYFEEDAVSHWMPLPCEPEC